MTFLAPGGVIRGRNVWWWSLRSQKRDRSFSVFIVRNIKYCVFFFSLLPLHPLPLWQQSSLRTIHPPSCTPFFSDLHNNRHMIIHVLIDIAQKARRNNTHPAKRKADQVHPPVALRIRNLAGSHDNLPRCVIARDTGYQLYFFEEGGTGEGDGGLNGFWAGDAEFELHGAADVVDGVGDEFGDEDVVIGRVADGATNDADGKGECCDGRDEVLRGVSGVEHGGGMCKDETYVRANDGGDDGSWYDDAPNSKTGEDQKTPGSVERIGPQASKSANA